MLCLRREIPEFEFFAATESAAIVSTGILFASKGNRLIQLCRDAANELRGDGNWGSTGPQLITQVIDDMQLWEDVQPSSACYPIPPTETMDLLHSSKAEDVREKARDALFLHIWNNILMWQGIDKQLLPPKGSYLRVKADEHRVNGWLGEYGPSTLTDGGPQREISDLKFEISGLKFEISGLKFELQHALREARSARSMLEAMRNSTSWRIAYPLRKLGDLLHGGKVPRR